MSASGERSMTIDLTESQNVFNHTSGFNDNTKITRERNAAKHNCKTIQEHTHTRTNESVCMWMHSIWKECTRQAPKAITRKDDNNTQPCRQNETATRKTRKRRKTLIFQKNNFWKQGKRAIERERERDAHERQAG